jgi:hypothetical protein
MANRSSAIHGKQSNLAERLASEFILFLSIPGVAGV